MKKLLLIGILGFFFCNNPAFSQKLKVNRKSSYSESTKTNSTTTSSPSTSSTTKPPLSVQRGGEANTGELLEVKGGTTTDLREVNTRQKVDRIEEGPKAQVERIGEEKSNDELLEVKSKGTAEDDLKPVKPTGASDLRETIPASKVERIEGNTTTQVERIEENSSVSADTSELKEVKAGSTTDLKEVHPNQKVDRIEDGTKAKVERIEEESTSDLLDVKANSTTDLKEVVPKQKVDRIEDGSGTQVERNEEGGTSDLLDVKSKGQTDDLMDVKPKKTEGGDVMLDPNLGREVKRSSADDIDLNNQVDDGINTKPLNTKEKDALLDVNFDENSSKSPNAGLDWLKEQNIRDNFSFNRKIGFMFVVGGEDGVSHFYLDTRSGASLLDQKGMQDLTGERMPGEINQLRNSLGDIFYYTRSDEGSFSFKMGSGMSPVLMDLSSELNSEDFFSQFKSTGKIVPASEEAIPFDRAEFVGKVDGKAVTVWLSNPGEVKIDTRYTHEIQGFFGLGYVASPSGKTYMVTGMQSNEGSIFMLYNQNISRQFAGSDYTSVGEKVAEGLQEMQLEKANRQKEIQEELDGIEDETIRNLKKRQAELANQMTEQAESTLEEVAETSDISKIGAGMMGPDFFARFYENASLESAINVREKELALKEVSDGGSAEMISAAKCELNCAKTAQSKLEQMKNEHLRILNNKNLEEDQKNQALQDFFLNFNKGQAPCNCQ